VSDHSARGLEKEQRKRIPFDNVVVEYGLDVVGIVLADGDDLGRV
jgi:hypothetical protein